MAESQLFDLVKQIEFDSLVKAEYQSKGYLFQGTFRTKTGFTGDVVEFRKEKYAIATKRSYQSDLVMQDPNFDKVRLVVEPYDATFAVDRQEEFLVNFSARQEYISMISKALGRTSDQIHLDALKNSGTTNIIEHGSTSLTYNKILQIVQIFDDLNVPEEDRFLVISSYAKSSLFKQPEFTSNDFNEKKIANGRTDTYYMGLKLLLVGGMIEGGLPKNGNIRTCYAFHTLSMGFANQDGPKTSVFFENMKQTWVTTGLMQCGATAVDPKGVIKIEIDETK